MVMVVNGLDVQKDLKKILVVIGADGKGLLGKGIFSCAAFAAVEKQHVLPVL